METSFLELRSKQVVNTVDGKCLGHITDVIFDVVTSNVLGFVVPEQDSGFWGLFKKCNEIFIPFNCVYKIGVDTILVEICINDSNVINRKNARNRGANCAITLNNKQK